MNIIPIHCFFSNSQTTASCLSLSLGSWGSEKQILVFTSLLEIRCSSQNHNRISESHDLTSYSNLLNTAAVTNH